MIRSNTDPEKGDVGFCADTDDSLFLMQDIIIMLYGLLQLIPKDTLDDLYHAAIKHYNLNNHKGRNN